MNIAGFIKGVSLIHLGVDLDAVQKRWEQQEWLCEVGLNVKEGEDRKMQEVEQPEKQDCDGIGYKSTEDRDL